METRQRTLRVLSIDGGGMRGLYTAAYLASLAKRYAVTRGVLALDIGKGFDLLVGTSTGGIIACALAIGLPLGEVVDLYRTYGKAIFPCKLPSSLNIDLIWQFFTRRKYLAQGALALQRVLKEKFSDTTLAQVYERRGIALAIPAVEMSRHHGWVFKTPHLPNTRHRDDRYQLADVCLATTAAPLFRSMAKIPNPDTLGHQVFVDGGLWANSPVLVGLLDALEMTEPEDSIELYSLGTCPRPEGEVINEQALHRGLVEWRFGGRVAALALDVQEFVSWNMMNLLLRHINRQCTLIRFPRRPVPADIMRYLDLDETSDTAMQALLDQAAADVNLTLSRCGDPRDDEGRLLHALLHHLPPC